MAGYRFIALLLLWKSLHGARRLNKIFTSDIVVDSGGRHDCTPTFSLQDS